MQFYNSRNKNQTVNFREALMEGLAPEGGLYCPTQLPLFSSVEMEEVLTWSRHDLASEIIHRFTSSVLNKEEVFALVSSAINFDIPLRQIQENVSVLELFHGPTQAFKDVGARFMARAMSHFLDDKKLTILVATSGDTGSAVADGYWNIDGIDVIVLFPKNGVSAYQQSQMTTLGNNITAIEVEGSFDDCQDLVKQAFQDKTIHDHLNLSSANSINIGRLLPQMLYYYFIGQQADRPLRELSICVPSGNFGNITSGLYANQTGLQFGQFIASTNSNSTFPDYLMSGNYQPRASVATLSNAMDVGKPSNFERIQAFYNHDFSKIIEAIKSVSISDESTIHTIREVYQQCGYLLDPHAAVGWAATQQNNMNGIYHHVILGTAHPRKFESAMHAALPDLEFQFPEQNKKEEKLTFKNDFKHFQEFLMNK